jgi:di/tricarboxylate transporter
MSPDLQQITFFAILIAAFGLLLSERFRSDLVAVLIILSLSITGLLTADEALAGFSSEPAIIVAAIFVLSGALEYTGISETLGRWIGHYTGATYERAIAVIMPAVALLSAFTHHLTTTAFMMPVMMDFSEERDIPPSKLLMPLSFAASLGTTITIVGAPAFLIASATLQRAGRDGLSIFSIAPIGIVLTLLGTGFMLFIGRFLLPSRRGSSDIISQLKLDRYFTELTILDESTLIGRTLEEIKARRKYEFTVAGHIRDGHRVPGPFAEQRLQAGDVLLVHTTPEDLVTFRHDAGIDLNPVEKFEPENGTASANGDDPTRHLVQAIVAPRSDMIGRSLRNIDFRRRYGALVVAFWRQGSFVQQELARIKLRAGDVLVLQGDEDALSRVGRDPAFLMIVPFEGEPRLRRRARIAALIMGATVGAAVLNVLPLQIVMLAGAAAVVLTGCITPAQAYRSIDVRIYVFIAGAIPLGTAMQKTGAADLVADRLASTVGGWTPIFILLAIFAVVGVLTQFMSDAATTALFAPLAVALARTLGHAPEAYVVTVAMASVVAFLTPIGHHGNLLVYGPGGYRFSDFVRVGTPLTVIAAVAVVLLSLALWPLT